jgi:hypothetical protein
LAVWLSALSTSWWSTLLTMSNDESAMRGTLYDPQPSSGPTLAVGVEPPGAGSLSSTKIVWVSLSPVFSPLCCCAGSQLASPAGTSTSRPTVVMQPPAERAQRHHHAVRVLVRAGERARRVEVLQHADSVVLEDDVVLVRVCVYRIKAHDPQCQPWDGVRASEDDESRATPYRR